MTGRRPSCDFRRVTKRQRISGVCGHGRDASTLNQLPFQVTINRAEHEKPRLFETAACKAPIKLEINRAQCFCANIRTTHVPDIRASRNSKGSRPKGQIF